MLRNCGADRHYSSTPGRINSIVPIGAVESSILDDGSIYVTRGGTSGHEGEPTDEKNRPSKDPHTTFKKVDGNWKMSEPSDRSRYGKVPIIRYEASFASFFLPFVVEILTCPPKRQNA